MISISSSSMQLTGTTVTPYFLLRLAASSWVSLKFGAMLFSRTIKGLLISWSSRMTLSSASSYSSLGMSLMLPSVVTTSPMVEWSVMTFFVPISAAILKGMASSNQGVFTMRGCSSSIYPRALGTI